MILDALEQRNVRFEIWFKRGTWQVLIDVNPLAVQQRDTGPQAVRAAALKYLRGIT